MTWKLYLNKIICCLIAGITRPQLANNTALKLPAEKTITATYVVEVSDVPYVSSLTPCGFWVKTFTVYDTTVATEFGSKMFCHFLGLHSLLSPQTHVLSYSPPFKDSVEWSNISVGWFRPDWWLFLEDKVKARKSEKCSNVFVSDRQLTSRKFIIHLWFATKIYKQENFLSF